MDPQARVTLRSEVMGLLTFLVAVSRRLLGVHLFVYSTYGSSLCGAAILFACVFILLPGIAINDHHTAYPTN